MTPVLPKTASDSTVGGVEYGDNEAVTQLLHLGETVGQDLNYEYQKWAEVYDGTRTTVDPSDVEWQPVGHGLKEFGEDEVGQAGWAVRKLPLPAYQVPFTDPGQGSGVYFVFQFNVTTFRGDRILEEVFEELASSETAEELPELLQGALDALSDVRSVAQAEDCDEPSDLAIRNAEVVLRKMFELSDRTYDIYPMSGGEVAIDAGNRGRRIGVFCYEDGRVQYVVLLDDERQDVRKEDVEDIPVDLLNRALNQLDS
jgi:hypothetical protein